MSTTLSAPLRDAEALVVEQDPDVRARLVSALEKGGYGVRTCDTLAEGRQHFARQSVVVTHANGDTAELRGFVNFVRQSAGTTQPYIVAVGDAASPSGMSQGQLGLDAFVPAPLEDRLFAEQIESMVNRRNGVPAPRNRLTAPTVIVQAARPKTASMLEHFAPVLLDHLPQALAMFDTEMRYLAANRGYTSAFGLDEREIIGRSHYELFPDLHANWRNLFERALAGETGRIDEDYFRHADGASHWVRWEVRPWREPDGEIGGLILSQDVINDRKREEKRQLFDRNMVLSIFESTSLPMLLVGLDGRILRSSPAARAALGLQPTADGRMLFWEVYPEGEQAEQEQARFAEHVPPSGSGALEDFEPADIIIPGFPAKRLHWSVSPHRSATGETQAILIIGSLIPVARPVATAPVPQPVAPAPAMLEIAPAQPLVPPPPAADEALEMARHLPFGLVRLDREGMVTAVNETVARLLGHSMGIGSSFEPWLSAAAPEEMLRDPLLREWRDNVWRRQMTRTFSLASADGLIKEIEVRPRLLPDGHLLLILSDVTESRRAEDAVRTSEAKYRGLFRELPVGIALANRAGALVEGNPALESLCGYSRVDLRRLSLDDLLAFDTSDASATPATAATPGASAAPAATTEARPAFLLARDGTRHPVVLSQGAIRNPAGDAVLQACFFLPRTAASAPAAAPSAVEPAASPASAVSPLVPPADEQSPWRDLAFENLGTAMLVTDLRGRIRAANPAAARFFGADARMLEGIALFRLFRPEDPAGFSRDVSSRINESKRWEAETHYHNLQGQPSGICRAEILPVDGAVVPGLLCILQPRFATA